MPRPHFHFSGHGSRLKFEKEARENRPPLFEIFRNNLYLARLSWQASKSYFCFKVVEAAVNGLMPVATSYMLKLLLDAITLTRSVEAFTQVVLLNLALHLVSPLFRFISTLTREKASINMSVLINRRLFERIARTEVICYDIPGWYDSLNNAIHSNADGFGIVDAVAGLISNITSIVVMSAIVISFNIYVFWAILLISAVTILIQQMLRKVRFNYMIDTAPQRRQSGYYSELFFSGRYAKERKMFNLKDWLVRKYEDVNNILKKKLTPVNVKTGSGNLVTGLLSTGLSMVVIYLAGIRAIAGELTIGLYTYYTSIATRLNSNIQGVVNDLITIYEKGLYARNMIQFLESDEWLETSGEEGVRLQPGIPHSIEFRHVTFAYPGQERPVLNDLSMVIRSGTKTCIAGDNGAGKSTLVKLMMRLYRPASGEIYIDGININRFDIAELRKIYGVVFQDFNCYSFTVAENILMRDVREPELPVVEEALDKGGIRDKIMSSRGGLNANLTRLFDEDGLELSGGEWQKLSVSRTYAHDADILIFDEPSSSLDARSEHELFRRFGEIGQGRTTVFISHRLSSARLADYIYYIRDGHVTEEGDHEQLMALNGEYAFSFRLQMDKYLEAFRPGTGRAFRDPERPLRGPAGRAGFPGRGGASQTPTHEIE